MSLKRLPSSTSDPSPQHVPPQRPNANGRSAYGSHAAPPPRRGYTPSSFYQRTPPSNREDVVEAWPDPANPDLFTPQEGRPAPRSAAPLDGDRGGQPPQNLNYAQATPSPPEPDHNLYSSWQRAHRPLLDLRPVFGIVVWLENRFIVHVKLYFNLQMLLGLLTTVSVLAFTNAGDPEKWQRLLETFMQIFS